MDVTNLLLSDDGLIFITPEMTQVIKDEVIIKNYFDNLSKKGIKRMIRTRDKIYVSLTFNDNTHVRFQNFNEIRKKAFSKELNKAITLFKLKEVAKKIYGKKIFVIGSVVGIASISVNILESGNEVSASSVSTPETISDNNIDEYLTPITIKLEDINEDEYESENNIEIDSNGVYVADRDYSKLIVDEKTDVDPLSLVTDDDEDVVKEFYGSEEIEPSNNIAEDETTLTNDTKPLIINNNIFNDGLDYTKLETLKDINSYDQFILIASNLYGVDYNKSIELVKEKWNTFTTPGKVVNDSYAQEIDRMKDLVNRGFINGDLNIIGIFLTIKDYAIDYLNLSKEPAIYSNKTQEEREKEILSIAKYIYGINDSYLLNLLIATTRVESANFTSAATINKNNIGGNMSTIGTFEHPVLNTYKTAEIGEESFVRNFLNCYGKSLVAHNYDRTLPIPYVMKDKLCPHTPNEWEKVITEKVEYVEASGVVDAYLNNSSKTI